MDEIKLDISHYLRNHVFIKTRILLIRRFLRKELTTTLEGTDIEFLAIQFRKIIEEIALASMVLHLNEYSKIRDEFEKDWNARLIFQDIKRLNPNFFPKAKRVNEEDAPDGFFTLVDIGPSLKVLTEKRLFTIYEKCGKYLHAFNPYAKNIIRPSEVLKQMKNWESEISELLKEHVIEFFRSKYSAFTKMNFDSKETPELKVFKPVT